MFSWSIMKRIHCERTCKAAASKIKNNGSCTVIFRKRETQFFCLGKNCGLELNRRNRYDGTNSRIRLYTRDVRKNRGEIIK